MTCPVPSSNCMAVFACFQWTEAGVTMVTGPAAQPLAERVLNAAHAPAPIQHPGEVACLVKALHKKLRTATEHRVQVRLGELRLLKMS